MYLFRRAASGDGTPIVASSDVWASVVANVAPLMALIGERNAKEYMRVASTRTQLFLMAAAPVGVLSILVSAVRLSGPRLLRRILGRESDRRSEALVELTPLSVDPATSAYTPGAVEIEPTFNRDRVAFVCSHVQSTCRTGEAMQGFKELMLERNGKVDASRDFELVLGLNSVSLTIEEAARLVTTVITEGSPIDPALTTRVSSASLSFRTTGISPSQTAARDASIPSLLQQAGELLMATFLCFLMIGIQVLGYYGGRSRFDASSLQSLIMGVCGYVGVLIFTFGLLLLLKSEANIEPQRLPEIFDEAIWSFSDARHAEHKAIVMPSGVTIAVAKPAEFSRTQRKRRHIITSIISAGLVGAYITFYLGLRVAPWWVGLTQIGIIWLAAGYRALVIKNVLVAVDRELGEHWLGTFRDTLYDSLLETTSMLERKRLLARAVSQQPVPQGDNGSTPDSGTELGTFGKSDASTCLLLSVKPIRQSLRNWSGCEDVIKVSLELAKRACYSKTCHIPCAALKPPKFESVPKGKFTTWSNIYRFQLMIYVPGLLWRSRNSIDYVLTGQEFDMPNIYRDLFKVFHLAADYIGDISTHNVTELELPRLSNILCGPITVPDRAKTLAYMTLGELLSFLKSTTQSQAESPSKFYTLEQAVLLPALQLSVLYEDSPRISTSVISAYQNQHIDKLGLSGDVAWLPTLEKIFEREGVWRSFMREKQSRSPNQPVERDETSGVYGTGFGNNKENQWLHADRVGVSYDKNVLEFR